MSVKSGKVAKSQSHVANHASSRSACVCGSVCLSFAVCGEVLPIPISAGCVVGVEAGADMVWWMRIIGMFQI